MPNEQQNSQLQLIDLDIPELGYLKFISSWLYTGPEGTFLIDPGPACTIPKLLNTLNDLGVKKLDWILLTHIHQDHAGGLGDLIKYYPDVKVVTNTMGAPHLVDPTKLWEGSKKILGDIAHFYKRILPIPAENVVVLDEIPFGSGMKVLPTPGHASHHLCFVFKDWFFAGELFGAHIPMVDALYLRPATPHRFIFEDYLRSMELVEPYLKPTICFAHYATAENPKLVLKTARDQLTLWVKIITEYKEENEDNSDKNEIIELLLENDNTFKLYHELDAQMQAREFTFSINSIDGILGYLETKK